jgi:hypothetical protein
VLLKFPDGNPRHCTRKSNLEGRDVQVRRDDPEAVGLENRSQGLDFARAKKQSREGKEHFSVMA